MPVGKNKPVNWYSLSKHNGGSIRCKKGDEDFYYDYIEGVLVAIEKVEDPYQGRKQVKYLFKLEDLGHSMTDILKIGIDASACRGLLASLTTIPDKIISEVRIRPYVSTETYNGEVKEFVNVDVSYRPSPGSPWQRLIELEQTKPLYQKIMRLMPDDQQDRRDYIDRMAEAIKKDRLNMAPAPEQVDTDTGEIIYGAPKKGNHRPVPIEIHKSEPDDSVMDWAEDQDDLPF